MIWGPWSIMDGIVFDDYDSFTQYMEQDIPARSGQASSFNGSSFEEQIGLPIYYDEQGNEISKEEALTRRLEDKNGNVVCEYMDLNESVISVQYNPKDGTILPITVYTEDDLVKAQQTAAVRHVIFGGVYCFELLSVMSVYFKKRAR